MSPESAGATTAGAVLGIDHVALPMQNTSAMIAFYRSFGLTVDESPYLVRVHLGDQMINFHRPEVWQRDLSLRAPAALPPVRRPLPCVAGIAGITAGAAPGD
jgi:catechol 2,3-dioxygenase-like lactoylglutathione lyase family enzyme